MPNPTPRVRLSSIVRHRALAWWSTPGFAVACTLALTACGRLHEDLPPGVTFEPGSIDVRGPGEQADAEEGTRPPPGVEQAPGTKGRRESSGAATATPQDDPEWPAGIVPTESIAADYALWHAGALDPATEASVRAAEEAILGALADHANVGPETTAESAAADVSAALEGISAALFGGIYRQPRDIAARDVAGDSTPELTVELKGLSPTLVAAHDGIDWAVHRLPAGWPTEGFGESLTYPFHEAFHSPIDFDGDGLSDSVYTSLGDYGGRSFPSIVIRVARWTGGAFEDLVSVRSEGRAAGAEPSWSVEPAADGHSGRLTTSCTLIGPLHSGAPYGDGDAGDPAAASALLEERTYTWTADAGLSLVDRSAPAPETAAELANVAEEAFRSGDLDTAEALFRQAVDAADDVALPAGAGATAADGPATDGVDWRALSMLRLGWLYAIQGRAAQARIAVSGALGGTGGVGEIADAFLAAYDTADAPRALAAALAARPYVTAGMNPDEVLWPGYVLAAWITKHGVETLGDEPATTLRIDLGLPIREVAVADLDGDGADEVAVVLERPPEALTLAPAQPTDLWIVDPGEPAAVAIRVTSGDLTIGGPAELPNGPGLNLSGAQASFILGWDNNVPALFSAEPPHVLLAYPPGRDPRVGYEPCTLHFKRINDGE